MNPKRGILGVIVGIVVWAAFYYLFLYSILGFITYQVRDLIPYVINDLSNNQQVVQRFGTPLSTGLLVKAGQINFSNGSGEALFVVPISGPKEAAKLRVHAFMQNNDWVNWEWNIIFNTDNTAKSVDTNAKYYLNIDGNTVGPFSVSESVIQPGFSINSTSAVKVGGNEWKTANQIPDFINAGSKKNHMFSFSNINTMNLLKNLAKIFGYIAAFATIFIVFAFDCQGKIFAIILPPIYAIRGYSKYGGIFLIPIVLWVVTLLLCFIPFFIVLGQAINIFKSFH